VTTHCWRMPEREYQYFACGLLRRHARVLKPGFLSVARTLVTTKPWWDTVDALAAHTVGPMVARHPELLATMDEWAVEEDLWLVRTAILHQLTYKEATDAKRLFHYCSQQAGHPDFFVRKAIGWALREYAKTDPAEVRAFVHAHEAPDCAASSTDANASAPGPTMAAARDSERRRDDGWETALSDSAMTRESVGKTAAVRIIGSTTATKGCGSEAPLVQRAHQPARRLEQAQFSAMHPADVAGVARRDRVAVEVLGDEAVDLVGAAAGRGPLDHAGPPGHPHSHARLLTNLPHDRVLERLAGLDTPTGQCPATGLGVFGAQHEQVPARGIRHHGAHCTDASASPQRRRPSAPGRGFGAGRPWRAHRRRRPSRLREVHAR